MAQIDNDTAYAPQDDFPAAGEVLGLDESNATVKFTRAALGHAAASHLGITNIADHGAVGDGVTDDTAAIQAAVDAAGLVVVPPRHHIITHPIVVPSNVHIVGWGPASIIENTHDGSGQVQTGLCVLFGNYNPAFFHTNGGTLTRDTITLPSEGDRTITTTTSNLTYSVGDLVMVYFDTDDPPFLSRVEAVAGSTLTLSHPFDEPIDNPAAAYVTKGEGDDITFTPASGNVTVDSYLCENAGISNVRLISANGDWTARTALLEGVVSHLRVEALQVVYGNAWTNCTIEDVQGFYSRRFIELTDGARRNTLRHIHGVYVEGGYDISTQAGVKLGRHDHLTDFSMNDYGDRTTAIVKLIDTGSRVSNGRLVLNGTLPTNVVEWGQGAADAVLEDVEIVTHDAIDANVLRFDESSRGVARNVTVRDLAGYGSGFAVRINADAEGVVLDGVHSPTGEIDVEGSLDAATADLTLTNCTLKNIDPGQTAKFIGFGRMRANRLVDIEPIAQLASLRSMNSTVTATTETTLVTRSFGVDTGMNLADRLVITADLVKTGTAGADTFKVTFAGKTITVTIPAVAGTYLAEIVITKEAQAITNAVTHHTVRLVRDDGTVVQANSTRDTGGAFTSGNGLTIAVWKGNAADTLVVRRLLVEPDLLGM